MSSSADRNLRFGILALQMDFITREQLVETRGVFHRGLNPSNVLLDEFGETPIINLRHAITIKKLTDTEFVSENDKGKTAEFKRKK